MSTRSTTHFVYNESDGAHNAAIIYRHTDGYPEGAGTDIYRFFEDVKSQTNDTRFGDPSYLAAKYVVWLADQFAYSYDFNGKEMKKVKKNMLDFLSVGVCSGDPGDIEYRYTVNCGKMDEDGYPVVTCKSLYGAGAGMVEIPRPEKEAA